MPPLLPAFLLACVLLALLVTDDDDPDACLA